MARKIIEMLIKKGDDIEHSDAVATLETIKMDNELKTSIVGSTFLIAVTEETH